MTKATMVLLGVAVVAPCALVVTGCRSELVPGMSQRDAWRWQETTAARRVLEANPITRLHPDQSVPDECEYMDTVMAGPGIGVANETDNVLKVGALIGATHVQWKDVETAHFYRCHEEPMESVETAPI